MSDEKKQVDSNAVELLVARQRARAAAGGRQRSFLLVPFGATIKAMLDADVSLPLVRDWLEEDKQVKITLRTLRLFVLRQLGEEFYKDYCLRNGWQRTTQNSAALAKPAREPAAPILKGASQQQQGEKPRATPVIGQTEGLADAEIDYDALGKAATVEKTNNGFIKMPGEKEIKTTNEKPKKGESK